jgi:hypothetical protein
MVQIETVLNDLICNRWNWMENNRFSLYLGFSGSQYGIIRRFLFILRRDRPACPVCFRNGNKRCKILLTRNLCFSIKYDILGINLTGNEPCYVYMDSDIPDFVGITVT